MAAPSGQPHVAVRPKLSGPLLVIRIHLVAAARPNFMKVAPLHHALAGEPWCRPVLIHTGQHYDTNMSELFFRDLSLPAPDAHLGVGSGSHAEQTAAVMVAYERLCRDDRPDLVVVVGDVNSTLACTLAAKKSCLAVAHLEAGLRSGDRGMPEEINRIVTDAIADLLWTPSPDADANLAREGVPAERVARVGNIMIDSYERLRDRIADAAMADRLRLPQHGYAVATVHRPANVDDPECLAELVEIFRDVARRLPLVLPIHPRTRARLVEAGLLEPLAGAAGVALTEPLSYVPFMSLVRDAAFVVTDSGGIQEETSYLDIPCLTLRDTTERPITLTQGSNVLVGRKELKAAVERVLSGHHPHAGTIDLWDGRTAQRIASLLRTRYA